MITIEPHPLLEAAIAALTLPAPLGALATPEAVLALLRPDAVAPMQSSDAVRGAVRDLLRFGGFKPTGRSKPASEYLIRAATEGTLGAINPVVDVCNAVSLHSGLPISVVDLDRTERGTEGGSNALRVAIAPKGTSYVFNATGQELDLGGLVALADGAGFCANAVKDAQRTKTHEGTTRVLVVVWGTHAAANRAVAALAWYEALIAPLGARFSPA